MTTQYKILLMSENNDYNSETADTLSEAQATVKERLTDNEAWGARNACIVHPDGKREYWETVTTLTAKKQASYRGEHIFKGRG